MARLPIWLGVAVVMLAGPALAAADGPGDPGYGRGLAVDLCGGCHTVVPGRQPDGEWPAPDLVERMQDPAMTELAVRSYLQTTHPVMPNVMLTREQTDDIVAYLLTVKGAAR